MKAEDLLLDETFLAWYYQSDRKHWSYWEKLRSQDPVLAETMDEAGKLLKLLASDTPDVPEKQLEAARRNLAGRIQQWESRGVEIEKPLSRGRSRFWWTVAAATVSLLIVASYLLLPVFGDKTYRAAEGETLRVELADGTVVNLNENSSLRAHFAAGKDREVWLEGEAFFEVTKKQDKQKFIVHASGLDVEVLGTRFNVKGKEAKTEVVLESGLVQLSVPARSEKKIMMQPGQLVEFSPVSGNLLQKEVNTQLYTSWKEGKVILENAQLEEIVSVLSERFHYEVEVEEGSQLGEFNGVFPSDDPNILITALQKTYPERIVQDEQTIRILKAK